ncbi:FAD-linked oxidoreductase [Sesbania bispinosa]|nr:FAD-linked oxidoreductase [Sesbania bispinosa]
MEAWKKNDLDWIKAPIIETIIVLLCAAMGADLGPGHDPDWSWWHAPTREIREVAGTAALPPRKSYRWREAAVVRWDEAARDAEH